MFWNKKEKKGPKELGGFLSRVVSREMEKHPSSNVDSDHWVKYMAVERAQTDDQDKIDFRIFDQWAAEKANVKVVEYSSLDDHPDLVLYEGWYSKKEKNSEVRYRRAA
jgi:hypothetical protein